MALKQHWLPKVREIVPESCVLGLAPTKLDIMF